MNLPKVHEFCRVPVEYREGETVLTRVVWPLVVWFVMPGMRVSQAIIDASAKYQAKTGKAAELALVGRIPSGTHDLIEVGGVTLVYQDWVEPGFVLVGRSDDKVVEVFNGQNQ